MNAHYFVAVLFIPYCYAANIHTAFNGKRLLPSPEYELRKLVEENVENEGNQHWVETPKIVASEEEIEEHQIVKRQSGLTLIDSITNTAALETAVINKHNELRSAEALQENAALMEKMYGNSDLASFAKTVTDTCYFDHSTNAERSNKFGFSYFGENLAVTTGGSSSPESLIQSWFNEKPDYNYDANSCPQDKMCGHYTQVVWDTSKYIGCAVTFCPIMTFTNGNTWSNAYYFACNYGPGGNYVGQRPYAKSTVCADCGHTCTQGLCDANAAVTTTPAPTAAPSTTSAVATTPTQAPTTTSAAATTPTQAPSTTSAAATTPTQAPTTTSAAVTSPTQAPTTTSAAATTSTQAPTTTSAAATPTTQAPTTTSAVPTTTSAAVTTTSDVTSATSVPLIPGCKAVDRNQYCAYYKTNYNICSSSYANGYLNFAIRSCKNTCNFCECRDFVNICTAYNARFNVCNRRSRNYWYGRQYCKKTCGFC